MARLLLVVSLAISSECGRMECSMRKLLLFGCLMIATSGCGTCLNLHDQSRQSYAAVYGGVHADLDMINDHCFYMYLYPMGILTNSVSIASVFDLPLSAVADTVTLPYALWVS